MGWGGVNMVWYGMVWDGMGWYGNGDIPHMSWIGSGNCVSELFNL